MSYFPTDFPGRDDFLGLNGVNLIQLQKLAIILAQQAKQIDKQVTIALVGDLGAGKTTFSQCFIHEYLSDPSLVITSPTYTYYRVYRSLVHADLYRCRSYDDFVGVGGEETFDRASCILVEWPDVIKPYYPFDIQINFRIHPTNLDRRIIEIQS